MNGGAMRNRTADLRIANESFLAVFYRFLGFLICRLHLCKPKHHYVLGQMRDTKNSCFVLIIKPPIGEYITFMP